MAQFEVSYQLGTREPNSGAFCSTGSVWYTMVVESSSLTNAQRQVEAMNGGYDRCLIGATFQKSN